MAAPKGLRKMSGASAPEIAISEPTERSMPPVAMTSVMPTETMTIVATWVRLTFSVCQAGEMRRDGEVEDEQHDERRQRGVAAQRTPRRRAARSLPARRSARQPLAASRSPTGVVVRHRRHDRRRARLGVRQIGDRAAVAQHEDAVGAFDDLLELGGDHQHAEALVGELADQRLDLGLGADVDAAGRLVEDQQLRDRCRASAPAAPSAGCRRTARGSSAPGSEALMARRCDEPVDDRPLARLVDDAHARSAAAAARA